jgi:hypothetical protein
MHNLFIELQKDPAIQLIYSEGWTCSTCLKHVALVQDAAIHCARCLIEKSGKDFIVICGWLLTRSGNDGVNASRIPH